MNCNKELHDELKESGDIVCPFCDQKLEDSNEKLKLMNAVIISILLMTMGC